MGLEWNDGEEGTLKDVLLYGEYAVAGVASSCNMSLAEVAGVEGV